MAGTHSPRGHNGADTKQYGDDDCNAASSHPNEKRSHITASEVRSPPALVPG